MGFARSLRTPVVMVTAFLAFAGSALALDSGVHVPALTGSVVDTAGLLDSAGRASVEQMLSRLEATGKAQMAVLVTDSLQGFDVESYSIAVVEKWQLGQKGKDNGLLLVIAPNERRMRLEVGYGLEGELTDVFSRRVLDGTLVPYFREQRYADGILLAIERIAAQLGADLRAPVADRIAPSRRSSLGSFKPILILILWILIFGMRRRRGFFGWSRGGSWGGTHGGWSSSRSGGFGGGGFSGGGGGFGGGGASGRW